MIHCFRFLLSNFVFKFNLRRYIQAAHDAGRGSLEITTPSESGCFAGAKTRSGMALRWPGVKAGAYTRPLLSSTQAALWDRGCIQELFRM